MLELFQAQVRNAPDAVAIDGPSMMTYGELDHRARQIASVLAKRGIGRETIVGVCLERGAELVASIIAIWRAGGAYLPLDPTYPRARLALMLEDSRAPLVLTSRELAENLVSNDGVELLYVESVDGDDGPSEVPSGPTALAYVIYTSGSTGRPKGVAVEHASLHNVVVDAVDLMELGPGDRVLQFTSPSFDPSLCDIFSTLARGATLCVASRDDLLPGPPLARTLQALRITHLSAPPSVLAPTPCDRLPELRYVGVGGELCARAVMQAWGPGRKFVNLYGPTETTIQVTHAVWNQKSSSLPIGRPIPNVAIHLLDDAGAEVPPGEVGEIHIGGVCLARGYLNRPNLTARRFILHARHGRLYRTGDLGRLRPDGQLEFLGRADTQVKIRGLRVELGEIENLLVERPQVRQAAVIRRETGASADLVAFVVADPDVDAEALTRHVAAHVPPYMVPSRMLVVDELPLTPNFKLDRAALEDLTSQAPRSRTEPRNEREWFVADTWKAVLALDDVGVHDDFFALGGTSLVAGELLERLHNRFGVQLTFTDLLNHPTVEALAGQLERTSRPPSLDDEITVTADEPEGTFPLTSVQAAYFVGSSGDWTLGGVSPHAYLEWNAQALDPQRLQTAFEALIARHPMLRSVVTPGGEQTVLPEAKPWQIHIHDLRDATGEAREHHLTELRERLSHQRFDPTRWPRFELHVTKLDEARARVHFSYDFSPIDYSSLRIMLDELDRLYQGEALEPLTLTFPQYLSLEAAQRQTERDSARTYWLARLDRMPLGPTLPLTASPEKLEAPRFSRREARLDQATWTRLKELAQSRSMTPVALLLTAFADVLRMWSRTPGFTLNLPVFDRRPLHPEVSRIVGDFTNLLLLQVDPTSGNDSLEARGRALQERLWRDYDHRAFSGVDVIRELSRRREVPAGSFPVVFTSLFDQTAGGWSQRGFPAGPPDFAITQTPQVWLDHQTGERDGELHFNWDAVEELFCPGVLDAMFAAYVAHLEHLAGNESAWSQPWHQTVERLFPTDQRTVRTASNATAGPRPRQAMHELVDTAMRRTPDAVAVASKARKLSYAELERLSDGLAARLRELEVERNTLVSIVMEKGWEQVVAALGIQKSGAAYVPIDAAYPDERRRHLIARAESRVVVTQPHIAAEVHWPSDVTVVTVDDQLSASTSSASAPATDLDALAYVIFTSGSTGQPKGVVIRHESAVNTIEDINARFDVGCDDRFFGISSLSFDLSVYDVFGALACGGTLVLPDPDGGRDPAAWLEQIHREKVTIWNSVPALMELLVTEAERQSRPLPPSLRLVMLSGDWIPLTLPDRIRALGNDVQVVSLGGATEGSIWSISYPIGELDPQWKSIPYGKPLRNQSFHVLDENLCPCPDWVTGELYIGGLGVAEGYWRDEQKTRARYLVHPRTGDRLYRTGDLGRYYPDGNIEFLGREDHQVKVQGYRIETGEIESALREHPAVHETVVMAEGERMGHKKLVAYVVTRLAIDWRRRELRMPLAAPARIVLEDGRELTARVDNISSLGLGIGQLSTAVPVSSRLDVAFRIDALDLELEVSCEVIWQHGDAAGLRELSASTESPLAQAAVELGLTEGHVVFDSRRTRPRVPLSGTTTLTRRDGTRFDAELVDLSTGGVGIQMREGSLHPDERLTAQLTLPHFDYSFCFDVRVAWTRGSRGGLAFESVESDNTESLLIQFQELVRKSRSFGTTLRSFLESKLPSYMIPSAFVLLDKLPLTANGKIDRKTLPTLAASRRMLTQRSNAPIATEVEQVLVDLWRSLVPGIDVGPDSHFFHLGGDSILVLQFVARARDLGLHVVPQDVYDHPILSELARELGPRGSGLELGQGRVVGEVPLLPGQRWFFEQELLDPHLWFEGHLIRAAKRLDLEHVQTVIDALFEHHDGLRTRYHRTADGWSQEVIAHERRPEIEVLDIGHLDEQAQRDEIWRVSEQLQAGLDLVNGPVLRTTVFELGGDRPQVLVMVGHHLVLDGFSWRILIEDFQLAYRQLEAGEEINLPAKTTSIQEWAEGVVAESKSDAIAADFDTWMKLLSDDVPRLPYDVDAHPTVESQRIAFARMTTEETARLLDRERLPGEASLNDLLLTGITDALADWAGVEQVLFDVMIHGRQVLEPPADSTRTIGRFTSVFPIAIARQADASLPERIVAVQEQASRFRARACTYGMLRYSREDPSIREALERKPQAQILINYVGQFDNVLRADSPFETVAVLERSENVNMSGPRPYAIELTLAVIEQALHMEWRFSENVLRRETVDGLVARCVETLQAIADAARDDAT